VTPTTVRAAIVPRRPFKVAILIPAGNVVGRDRVVAYHHGDVEKIVDTDMNVGDTFVFEATLRLIDYDEVVFISAGDGDISRTVDLLDSCDVAVLRGSNYIHPGMCWGRLPAAVERSRVPVVAFGIGSQAPRYEALQVSGETERFLKVVSERCHSIGCRGVFTAQTLLELGIGNVVPIGCPSLFRNNNRNLQIRLPARGAIKRVGFTLARGMCGMYCDSPSLARAKQLKVLEELHRSHDVFVVTQGQKSEKIFYYRLYDRITEAKTLMQKSGWDLDRMPWLEQLYWSRIFFGTSPADYEKIMGICDLAIGYRLHANIMALSIGKPAIFHTYDSRTREIVEHFAIPSYDIMCEDDFRLDDMLLETTFDRFNARFPIAYDETREFLVANGIPTRMTGPAEVAYSPPPPPSAS
jgi:hypothetical protein